MLCFLELTISYSALTCLWLGNSNEFFISQNVFLNSRIFITFFYKSFIYLYNIYIFINWPLNMFLLIITESFILLIPTLRSSVVSCWQLYSLEYVPRFLASSHAWYFFFLTLCETSWIIHCRFLLSSFSLSVLNCESDRWWNYWQIIVILLRLFLGFLKAHLLQ